MTLKKAFLPGTFSWADLATTNPEAAKLFYGELFGWSYLDKPVGEDEFYSLASIEGDKVCALYRLPQDKVQRGISPHLLSYITVDDAAKTCARAEKAGGKIVTPPYDVFEAGRMAVIDDGAGAIFAVWQPNRDIGAERVNLPGCLCWNELNTRDIERAKQFYSAVFDWDFEHGEGTQPYLTFSNQGRLAGGMIKMGALLPPEIPEHWNVYFAVKDCMATLTQAEKLGGTILLPATDIPNGRFAILRDPQGATFCVIQLAARKIAQRVAADS